MFDEIYLKVRRINFKFIFVLEMISLITYRSGQNSLRAEFCRTKVNIITCREFIHVLGLYSCSLYEFLHCNVLKRSRRSKSKVGLKHFNPHTRVTKLIAATRCFVMMNCYYSATATTAGDVFFF